MKARLTASFILFYIAANYIVFPLFSGYGLSLDEVVLPLVKNYQYVSREFFWRFLLLAVLAYAFSIFFDRRYVLLIRKIKEMRSGNYLPAVKENMLFPELSANINELSSELANEQKKLEQFRAENSQRIKEKFSQVQQLVAEAKGKLEVLQETCIIPQELQENILLRETLDRITEAENELKNTIFRQE